MRITGRGLEYDVVHLRAASEQPLLNLLSSELSLARLRADELLWLGAIYINDERLQASSVADIILNANSHVRIHTQPRRFYNGPLKEKIVFSNSEILVVDKPGGLPSHSLVDNRRENLLELLSSELNEKLFITHRLDTPTSGLIILARTPEALSKINALIKERKIKRTYEAWVEKAIGTGKYVHYMEPSPKAPKKLSSELRDGWQECSLVVETCEAAIHPDLPGDFYRLRIQLITGRSQQIRAQLAHLQSPILGDALYGSRFTMTDPLTSGKCIALRAVSVSGFGFEVSV